MTEQELKDRLMQFALRVIRLVQALPDDITGRAIGSQLIRSATSVGANYRSACVGRSKAEFASKLGIAVEEADESCFWLELTIASNLMRPELVADLLDEAEQIFKILAASRKTSRQ